MPCQLCRFHGYSSACSAPQVALSNLDAVLMEARGVADQMPHHLLHEMEQLQQGAAPLPAGYGLAEGRQGAMLSLPVPHARRRPTAAPADIGETFCRARRFMAALL